MHVSNKHIFFLKRQLRLWGTLSLLLNGYRFSFPGAKRRRFDIDYSPPFSG